MGRNKKIINQDQIERVKQALNHKRMKQREIALALGVGETAVSKWMNGRNAIPNHHIQHLAEICEVNPDWLLCVDGVPMQFDDSLASATANALDDDWLWTGVSEYVCDRVGLSFVNTRHLSAKKTVDKIQDDDGAYLWHDNKSKASLADRIEFDAKTRNAKRVIYDGIEYGVASLEDVERLHDILGQQLRKVSEDAIKTFLKAVAARSR